MWFWQPSSTRSALTPADTPSTHQEAVVNLLPACLRAVLAGGLGGALAALLLLAVGMLQGWIWGDAVGGGLATPRPLAWCLVVPTGLGVLLSLMGAQQSAGRLPEFGETLAAVRHRPANTAPEQHGSGGTRLRQVLTGGLALIGGGSLGPEALVSHAVMTMSRWIWHGRDRAVSTAALAGSLGFFGTPLVGPIALAGRHTTLLWRWLPGTLAGITGFIALQGLRGLGHGLDAVPFHPPLQEPSPVGALMAALAGGAMGCGCSHGLQSWRRWLRSRNQPHGHPLAPVLTGLAVGLSLWGAPLAAFSGETQLLPLLLDQWGPTPSLLLNGVLKLLLTGLCLETGWRGGLIFPVLVGSSAIGMGLHQLLPNLGPAALWYGSVTGGCLGTLLPSALLALVLGLVLLQGHGAEALLIGLLLSQVLRQRGVRHGG